MSNFIRRFLSDPGDEVLLEIESVNILDLEPPSSIQGVGSGTALHVGEFEDGPFNLPTEVFSANDLLTTFGSFGYTYGGVPGNNPSAQVRRADSALVDEYWNGNGFVQLSGKKFSRLVICRVDTSVGSVQFTRQAGVYGGSKFRYNLSSGELLALDIGAGPISAPFTAAAATTIGVGGVFPTTFIGGESLVLGYDDTADFTVYFLAADQSNAQVVSRINTFAGYTMASVDGGQVRLTGRKQGTAGEIRVVSGSPGVITQLGFNLTLVNGSETSSAGSFPVALVPGDTFIGKVDQQVVATTLTIAATRASITGAGATYAAVTAGHTLVVQVNGIPGNQTVTFAGTENTQGLYLAALNAQLAGVAVIDNGGGQITIETDRKGSGAGGAIVSGSADVLASLGLTAIALTNPGPNNVIDVYAVTAAEFAGLLTSTFTGGTAGSTGVNNGGSSVTWKTNTSGPAPKGVQWTGGTGVSKIAGFDLTEHNGVAAPGTTVYGTGNVGNIAAVTPTEVDTVVAAAITGARIEQTPDGRLRAVNAATPATGTIEVGPLTTATDLGFVIGDSNDAAIGVAGTIPAGTQVRDPRGGHFVTMQTTAISASNAGPYTIKVRHATDDLTGLGELAGAVVQIETPVQLASFAVINPLPITNALTDDEIDVRYSTAIDGTLNLNTVAKQVNLMWSARQSNVVRLALKENALTASANGFQGRCVAIRTPMNTLKEDAKSIVAEPGVGAYRDQRVFFCYPQAQTYIKQIAARGIGAGAGFTSDGVVDVGADGFLISVCSQLPPEENPAQSNAFMGGVLGLESGSNVQSFVMSDYTSFKRSGIVALRIADGEATFQSGVTSVDPVVNPALKNINRRRMADFIQDSIAQRLVAYGKKLSTVRRRKAMVSEMRSFLNGLQSVGNPSAQRIDSFSLDDKSGNTVTSLAQGLFRVITKVKTLPSLDSIVIQSTVGESVVVEEVG